MIDRAGDYLIGVLHDRPAVVIAAAYLDLADVPLPTVRISLRSQQAGQDAGGGEDLAM